MKTLCLALLLTFATSMVGAEDVYLPPQAAETTGVLGGGIAFGGDKIDEIEFDDGENDSIRAGSGLWFDLGFRTQFQNWALKGTLGYKSDSVSASNGDASFSRLPITFIASFTHNNNSFGAGFTHELNPKYDIDFSFVDYSVDFDDATGLVLEYERDQGTWGWGVRYTFIDYETDELGPKITLDGNNLGIFANWYF